MKRLRNEFIYNCLFSLISFVILYGIYRIEETAAFGVASVGVAFFFGMYQANLHKFQLYYLLPYSKKKIIAFLRLPMFIMSVVLSLLLLNHSTSLYMFLLPNMLDWLIGKENGKFLLVLCIVLMFSFIRIFYGQQDSGDLGLYVFSAVFAFVICFKYIIDCLGMNEDIL